jgi:hypothetical protein
MFELIKPGHYKLSRDVTNPQADRRTKNERDLPVWKAGTKIYVREMTHDGVTKYTAIEFIDSRWPTSNAIGPGMSDQYEALRSALEPVAESFKRLMHRLDTNPYWVLKRLHQMGVVTAVNIEEAAALEDSDETNETAE